MSDRPNETAPTPEQARRLRYMLDRQYEAYHCGHGGTWAQRWIPGVCKHPEVRCTHGDEILGRRGRRQVCTVCGRSLDRGLPVRCFFTGEDHPSMSGLSGGNVRDDQ